MFTVPGKNMREQIHYLRAGGRMVYPGVGASSRTASQPSVDTEVGRLVAASKSASTEFDRATASGNPSAIASARAELQILAKKLEAARADGIAKAAMAEALGSPMRMTR
jgi:hypothetical protein